MTGARYLCCDDDRREVLLASGPTDKTGIDYIEVTQGNPVVVDVHLVRPLALPGAALTKDNVRITGGVRLPAPKVADVEEHPAAGPVAFYRVVLVAGAQTDFSTYRLTLVAGPGLSAPPVFIDPRLSAVDFSFKVDCPSDFDCVDDGSGPRDPAGPEASFDGLARDWDGFRRLMLDRMSVLVPGFREDDPVDLTTTIIEALAWRADQQSYRIDWVATEAFLDTARSPASVSRHARLVDYTPGQGASARCFIAVGFKPGAGPMADGMPLAKGTPLLPRDGGAPVIAASGYPQILAQRPVVFELAGDLPLWAWRNEIALHTWSDGRCALPRGATAATLVNGGSGASALKPGDFLLFEEIAAPDTGAPEDADPTRRHVVRLTGVTPVTDILSPAVLVDVTWSTADAMPFDLVIDASLSQISGPPKRVVCAVARGNVMLADHGASLPPAGHLGLPPSSVAALRPRLDPPVPLAGESWRPRLSGGIDALARVAPHLPSDPGAPDAASLMSVDPAACAAALRLTDSFARWTARRDLLASGPFDRDVVVETGPDNMPFLRFGDGVHGLQPSVATGFTVTGRFGTGPAGMLGADALGRVVLPDGLAAADVLWLRNPLPARGGAAPESAASIRIAAPQAFRVQDRAVTAADYAAIAMRHPEVANAVAIPRWTGAWQTMLVYVDRTGGLPVDRSFSAALLRFIERFRLAGFDVAVRGAVAVPLDIALEVCAMPEAIRATVGQRVRRALSPFGPADGAPGFFHPDNFTFGSALYLSRLIAAVMAVEGVQSVRPVRFQRFRTLPTGEIDAGLIRPVGTEILELRDDPNFPEGGRLDIRMGGGR
jgi:Baseplate J-like protein